jgi:hypothetical protein
VEIPDILARIDDHLHQQDLYLKQQDERLGRGSRTRWLRIMFWDCSHAV